MKTVIKHQHPKRVQEVLPDAGEEDRSVHIPTSLSRVFSKIQSASLDTSDCTEKDIASMMLDL